jgi:hypothetical protein
MAIYKKPLQKRRIAGQEKQRNIKILGSKGG